MAGHGGDLRKQPMDLEQLEKFRHGVGKLNDNELARQYRYLHGRLALEDGVPTPNARVVQEFIQIWREAHRRGRITPLPTGVR
ncbi:MAG TPA: hypothetical protein VKB88_27635 [Bryobacteraceae bacterium]|nr:hypothetical protein [Bryobacteraceae bacterium]